MYDQEDRPYALVFLKDEGICVNTYLIEEYLANIDLAAPDKLDFIYHPSWLELGQRLQEQLEAELAYVE